MIVPILAGDENVAKAATYLREMASRLERGDIAHVVVVHAVVGGGAGAMVHASESHEMAPLIGALRGTHDHLSDAATGRGIDPVGRRP